MGTCDPQGGAFAGVVPDQNFASVEFATARVELRSLVRGRGSVAYGWNRGGQCNGGVASSHHVYPARYGVSSRSEANNLREHQYHSK